jgi:hypothetical protein
MNANMGEARVFGLGWFLEHNWDSRLVLKTLDLRLKQQITLSLSVKPTLWTPGHRGRSSLPPSLDGTNRPHYTLTPLSLR